MLVFKSPLNIQFVDLGLIALHNQNSFQDNVFCRQPALHCNDQDFDNITCRCAYIHVHAGVEQK